MIYYYDNSISIKLFGDKFKYNYKKLHGGNMDTKELAKIFKALSNDNRLEIYKRSKQKIII